MVRKGGGLSWQKQMRQLILRRNIRSGRSETAEKWKGEKHRGETGGNCCAAFKTDEQ